MKSGEKLKTPAKSHALCTFSTTFIPFQFEV